MASSSSVLRPACRPDAIQTIITTVDRYNVQNAQTLEAYLVDEQIANGTYDLLANLALLKLLVSFLVCLLGQALAPSELPEVKHHSLRKSSRFSEVTTHVDISMICSQLISTLSFLDELQRKKV